MHICNPLIGDDSLRCKRDGNNIQDENAVGIIHSNYIGPRVVSQVPLLYSSRFKKVSFFTKSYNKGDGYWKEN